MTFQPVLVGSGLVAWQFLKSTGEAQRTTFNSSSEITRDTDYFEEKIGSIRTTDELVADRRLLRVALGAFGLQDDIDNKFFIKKILDEGGVDNDALAVKLADERYKSFASAFAFDSPVGPRTQLSFFGNEIVTRFRDQSFEVAVGNQDNDLRLALNLSRALPEIAEGESSDSTKWFKVMGTTALRKVFETALGLPSSFAQIDLDKQLEVFKEKSASRFGVSTIDELAQPENLEKVVQSFLLQSQISQSASIGSGTIALSLLQSIPRTSISQQY
ncbi:DUF1217 domain-containing protein [Pacificoceanicola onchidii]|uniref:DUF1217 domain-containing protein n=1 Tax=Pacificoceanicola onchidii TaxID=2562685 RepID=UPI0010A61D17|nr:DUF1217 domain-containing protein [Pacificoceanicola onchidii]